MTKKIAVVLAGAVAKGAFEAGALAELTKKDVSIRRIVASSAGALNGAMLAAAVHGAEEEGHVTREMEKLGELWVAQGDFHHAFHFRLKTLLHGVGASDHTGLFAQLRSRIRATARGALGGDIELKVIVSPLTGVLIDGRSSFELALPFTNADFQSREGIERVFKATVASASFPGAFTPFDPDDYGPCVDGGTVNNTPLKYAVDGDPTIDAVVVIAPTPENNWISPETAKKLRYFGLIGRLADMLINERIYRDLKEAHDTNLALLRISQDPELKALESKILHAIGWNRRRRVEIVTIRPENAGSLEGNSFSGFKDAKLRAAYVHAGAERAKQVTAGWD